MTSRQNYWEVSVSSIDLTQVDHKFGVRSIFMHFPAYVGLDGETLDFASRESTYARAPVITVRFGVLYGHHQDVWAAAARHRKQQLARELEIDAPKTVYFWQISDNIILWNIKRKHNVCELKWQDFMRRRQRVVRLKMSVRNELEPGPKKSPKLLISP